MFKALLPFIFIIAVLPASAQLMIKGRILNSRKQPVLFASIGYYQHREGGSTDSLGRFQIAFIKDDSLKISAIGYLPKTILFSSNADTVIYLTDDIKQLSDVVVTQHGKRRHKKYIGHFERNNKYATALAPQLQTAIFIPNENTLHGFISDVHFKLGPIAGNKLYLRIRFYKKDSLTNMPGEELKNGDTILAPEQLQRNNRIDVSKRNLKLPMNGVFVSLEWLAINNKDEGQQPPEMYGNSEALENFTYYNFKEIKWAKAETRSAITNTFDVLNLEIEIVF